MYTCEKHTLKTIFWVLKITYALLFLLSELYYIIYYHQKSEDGKSSSSKSFHKEFNLPACANLDLVSTALSKDGVLTVRAPKKVCCDYGTIVLRGLRGPSTDGVLTVRAPKKVGCDYSTIVLGGFRGALNWWRSDWKSAQEGEFFYLIFLLTDLNCQAII